MVKIYTLSDPRTGEIRYVGQTHRTLKLRYYSHVNPNKRETTHNSNWIRNLRNLELKPIIELVDEVSEEDWEVWEKYWISQFRCWGFNLNNHTSGGDSKSGVQIAIETRKKAINSCKDRKLSQKGKDAISLAWKGKKRSRESVLKSIQTRRDKGMLIWSDAAKLKSSLARKGKPNIYKRIIVLQYDIEDNFIKEWESITEASKILQIYHGSIDNCLAGRTKTANGFKWKYKDK